MFDDIESQLIFKSNIRLSLSSVVNQWIKWCFISSFAFHLFYRSKKFLSTYFFFFSFCLIRYLNGCPTNKRSFFFYMPDSTFLCWSADFLFYLNRINFRNIFFFSTFLIHKFFYFFSLADCWKQFFSH